ncbi:MAG: hypothetical protein WA655_09210 [Candidatus Korobacteraceae bacterium]
MTDEDRAAIYGQAMLSLKQCRADAAALRSYFSDYAQKLESAHIIVKAFLEEPEATHPVPWAGDAKKANLRLTSADFDDKVEEFLRVRRRIRELEDEVSKF